MSRFYDPNVILALAASYDTRGGDGYQTIRDGRDQQKINSMYEPVKNSFSGRTKLLLTNRPGFGLLSPLSGLTSSDTQYIRSDVGYIAGISGTSTKTWSANSTVTVTSGTAVAPIFSSETNLSGVIHSVLQVRNSLSNFWRAFYTSSDGNTWTEIGHANYTSGVAWVGKMEHLDGFGLQMNTSNQIRNSSVNTLADWGGSDYVTKSVEQDSARGLVRHGKILLAFGADTVEGFYNAGRKNGSPLAPIRQAFDQIGLAADTDPTLQRSYSAYLGGRTYFLGSRGSRSVLGANGFTPSLFAFDGSRFEKVSPPFIDKILTTEGTGEVVSVTNVQAVGVFGKYGIAISLVNPSSTTQRALFFFPDWNDWFEWTSTAFQFVGSVDTFLGIRLTTTATRTGAWTVDNWTDAGTSYTMLHQFKLPKEDNSKLRMDFAGLVGDTALDNANANVSTSLSYDGYSTFTYVGAINMAGQDKSLSRLGAFKEAEVKLEYSGSTQIRLEKFVARVR